MAVRKFVSVLVAVAICFGVAIQVSAKDKTRLNANSATLEIGESKRLAVLFPHTVIYGGETPTFIVADEDVAWSSSDSTVATVSSDGWVTAIAKGNATITATTQSGTTLDCRIKVVKEKKQREVTSLELPYSELTLKEKDQWMLWAQAYPENAEDPEVLWSSSNPAVADVDEIGMVTAFASGTTVIRAVSYNNTTATCTITVKKASNGSKEQPSKAGTVLGQGEPLRAVEGKQAVKDAIRSAGDSPLPVAVFKNVSSVSAEALKEMLRSAQSLESGVRLQFVTTDADGKTAAWMAVNPQLAKDRESTLKTGVYTTSSEITAAQQKLEKRAKKPFAVVQCMQKGSLGMQVKLAVKTKLAGMNDQNLYFYTYNEKTGTTYPLANTFYSIDKNGYIRFYTEKGGLIVISVGEITEA